MRIFIPVRKRDVTRYHSITRFLVLVFLPVKCVIDLTLLEEARRMLKSTALFKELNHSCKGGKSMRTECYCSLFFANDKIKTHLSTGRSTRKVIP